MKNRFPARLSRLGVLVFASAAVTALGCSLIVEFDESKIPVEDTGVAAETSVDTGAAETAVDTGATETDVDTGVVDTGAVDSGGTDAADSGGDADTDSGPTDTGTPDTGTADTGTPDTGTADTGTPDTGEVDTGTPDTGTADTGTPDTGTADTGTPDTGTADTGTPDTGEFDTGTPDTGTADTGTPDTGEVDTGVTDTGAADTGPETASFTSILTGGQAGTTSTSTGTVKCTLTFATKQLACTVTHDLASSPSAAHIHLGAAGVSGGAEYDFGSTLPSGFTGTFTLSDTNLANLLARKLYVNLHTSPPGGEIRGQLLTPGETLYLANLSAAPSVTTSGLGQFGVVKLADGSFAYSGSASGLNNDATTAAIEKSSDGTTEQSINMTALVKTGVLFQGTYLATALNGTLLAAASGAGYRVNVNTAVDTAGEIRGNLLLQFVAPAP